jgi:hypothetical protein
MSEGERSSAQHHENMWEAVAEGRWGEGGIEDPAREDGHGRGFRTPATSPDGPPTAAVDDSLDVPAGDPLDASEDSLEAGTLNILEVPSPFGASGAPAELLRALGRLIDTLNAERRSFSAAEERARKLEVKTVRLEAILVAESEMRRRAEEELSRLRAEIEERRRRTDENVERMLDRARSSARTAIEPEATTTSGGAEAAEPDTTAGPASALQRDRSPQALEPAPIGRARGREGGPPTPSSPAAEGAAPTGAPSPSHTALSPPSGRSDARDPWGPPPPSANMPASAHRRAPPPPSTRETTGAAETGTAAGGQPPPLLPGWRYASELEGPPRRRWPWRLRSRDRA